MEESADIGGVNSVPTTGSSSGDNDDNNGNSDNNPPLKNAERAQMNPAKFYKYSMDPSNPNNQGKWEAFADVGYNVYTPEGRNEGARDVMAQVEDQLPQSPAIPERITPFGSRYEVEIEIEGPNGRKGTLVTIWQYDTNSASPRLITNWLEVHK